MLAKLWSATCSSCLPASFPNELAIVLENDGRRAELSRIAFCAIACIVLHGGICFLRQPHARGTSLTIIKERVVVYTGDETFETSHGLVCAFEDMRELEL